jgi:ubiquitin-conjugating enzyme E2 A
MSSGKNICIKRINKDIKEITKNPIEGIGIVSLDNDLMKYIVNICIMNGIYKGYCVQLRLTFPDNYPTKPPKILIYPDQAIDGQYHHHIFPDNSIDEKGHHFKKFCFDLLDNDFMSISTEHSGWNPSYSITSLLLQVQNFLGDPDMHESHLPNKEKIAQLMKSMDTYERTFTINDENGETKKVHTWKNPYPEMYIKPKEEAKEKEKI